MKLGSKILHLHVSSAAAALMAESRSRKHAESTEGAALREQILAELNAVKRQIGLDDERLRRALTTSTYGAEETSGNARATDQLRDQVANLQQLRIVQAAQIHELEASNEQLEHLVGELERTNMVPWPSSSRQDARPGGADGESATLSPWISQLQTMIQHERARKTALTEEKRILQHELSGLNHEIKMAERQLQTERSRREISEEECGRLETELSEAMHGKDLIVSLIDEVKSLKSLIGEGDGRTAGKPRGDRSRGRSRDRGRNHRKDSSRADF